MNIDELPPMSEALLDERAVSALFDDIGALGELLDVQLKGGARSRASDAACDLSSAKDALLSGATRAVQLRYRHKDTVWWDTLLRQGQHIKLVRIEAPTFD